MVQIIPAPDFGAQLSPLFQGLNVGLQNLLQLKQQRGLQQQQGNALAQFLGISGEQQELFSKLSPSVQAEVAKKKMDMQQRQLQAESLAKLFGVSDGFVPTPTPTPGEVSTELDGDLSPQMDIPKQPIANTRDELRRQYEQRTAQIVASEPEIGKEFAQQLLQMEENIFKSRDKEFDLQEKEALKAASEAKRRFAKRSDERSEEAIKAQNVKLALAPVKEAIQAGQSGPTLRNVLAESANQLPDGPIGSALKNVLLTPTQQVFKSGQGPFFQTLKQSFGANVSTLETQMYLGSLFKFATDPDAQQFSVEYQDILADRTIKAAEISNSLLDEDGIPVKNARKIFDAEMTKVLKEGEERLQQTNWWKKTKVNQLEKETTANEQKRNLIKSVIGRQ